MNVIGWVIGSPPNLFRLSSYIHNVTHQQVSRQFDSNCLVLDFTSNTTLHYLPKEFFLSLNWIFFGHDELD